MKISPLVLFLILLIVLLVSIIIGKKIRYEGFISYKNSVNNGNSFVIPSYSNNTLFKLYDNLFFDSINANLLEIDSPAYTTTNSSDDIGNTILTTTVIPRTTGTPTVYNGNVSVMSIPKTTIGTNITNNYNNFVYTSKSQNTDKYCVFYIPWNVDTYIHILNVTNKKHVGSFLQSNTNNTILNSNIYNNVSINLNTTYSDNDVNNNTFLLDNYYDNQKTLYQISKNVKFDITNGSLILQRSTSPTKTISIYTRNNMSTPTTVNTPNTVSNTASTIQNVNFTPTIIEDKLGNVIVLYLPNGTNTVVAVFGLTNDMSTYQINNVVRFTANTIDVGSGSTSSTTNIVSMFNSFLSNHWNANSGNPWQNWQNGKEFSGSYNLGYQPPYQGYPNTYPPTGGYSDDYILKTQIVPPVCPSCPSCSKGGVCGNCGGNGGSGTQTSNGNTMVSGNKPHTNDKDSGDSKTNYQPVNNIGSGTFSSNADANTFAGGLTLTGYDTVAGAEDIAKTGADVLKTGINDAALGVGAVGLGIGAAGLGLGSAVSDTVSGAANLAEKAGGGAVGLLRDTGSGAVGLLKSAGSGITNNSGGGYGGGQVGGYGEGQGGGYGGGQVGSQGGGYGGGQGGGQRGQTGYTPVSNAGPQTMDQYSYYGTLPSKGSSNFMPVTADFSSFRH